MIKVDVLRKTRPHSHKSYGLATFLIEVPLWVWYELLTHKRLARNASSARAESFKRHSEHGWYMPDTFYSQGNFMQSGDPLPEDIQDELVWFWTNLNSLIYQFVDSKVNDLKDRGYKWSKEQYNRLLPTSKLVRGVVTGTESAWNAVLNLRLHPTADKAMQEFAQKVRDSIAEDNWNHSHYHIPGIDFAAGHSFNSSARIAGARLARVSTSAPKSKGQRSDEELAATLINSGHLSPFEHIATWGKDPLTSAVCTAPGDYWKEDNWKFGWTNYRAIIEG